MSDLTNIAGQLYVEPGRRNEFVQLVQRNGEVSEFESQVYRRDGRVIWISENAAPHATIRGVSSTTKARSSTLPSVSSQRACCDGTATSWNRVWENERWNCARINQALEEEITVRKRAEEAAAAANRAKSAVSCQHEPRDPHADERDPRLCPGSGRDPTLRTRIARQCKRC